MAKKTNIEKKEQTTTNNIVTEKISTQLDEVNFLRSQVNDLKDLVNALITNQNNNQNTDNSNKSTTDVNRWVKIIHLEERAEGLTTHVKLSTRPLDFTFFGEERMVRFTEFEELVGKYKRWFEETILALSDEDSDLIDKYRLTKLENIALKSNQLSNIKNLSLKDLEDLYNKVSKSHKRLITRKFVHGYYELKEMEYGDRKKIDLLNELSGGALQNMLDDLIYKAKKK